MTFWITLLASIFLRDVRSLVGQPASYSCTINNKGIRFTLSSSWHSAWRSTSDCSLQQCRVRNDGISSCRTLATPCFDYRTYDNTRYCAPGILCSILESCNTMTNTCSSNTSVCVVNSCCSPSAVCLPLSMTQLCVLAPYGMPSVLSAFYDAKEQAITMNISYSGGCKQHAIELQAETCRGMYPVQCDAKVIDYTVDDTCSALLFSLFSVNLHITGLDKSYYNGAFIHIQGGNHTKFSIQLPLY